MKNGNMFRRKAVFYMEGFNFTGIEPIIEWMEQTGLLDAITQVITDVSVETLISLIVLAVTAIGSLAAGGVALVVLIVTAIVAVITFIVSVIVIITLYVLRSIGLFKIAKKLEVKHRFLAWIPYGHAYLLGKCAEASAERNGKKTWKWGWILLITSLALGIGQPIVQGAVSVILSVMPFLSVIISALIECSSIVLLVMTGYCMWCIYKEFMNHVLAVICPLGGWIGDAVLCIVGFFKLRPAVAVSCDEPVVVIASEDDLAVNE